MFEGIHEYFARLLFICCSCIICELVSEYAHSKSSSVSQALNVVCCLCVCVTVFSFFTGGSDIFPEAENILKSAENAGSAYSAQTGSDALIEQSRIALESELSQSIFENYGIKPADISIQFSINHNQDETQVSVSNLQLLFPLGTPQDKASAAASYAKNMLGCQATVQISDN